MRTTHMRKSVWLLVIVALIAMVVAPAAAADTVLGFDVRFVGVIETVGGPGEPWVIGGQTLATDADTTVMLTVSPAAPGLWAEVAAARQDDDSLLAKQITVRPEKARLRGVLESMPAEGVAGDWVISGITVVGTEDTQVSDRGGAIAEGNWVEAVMTEDAGVLTATNIMGIVPRDAVEISGEIQAFSDTEWVLSSLALAVDDGTLISGTPVVGLVAHASAEVQGDGSLLALGLRVSWIDSNSLAQLVDVTGVIAAQQFVEPLPGWSIREWTLEDGTTFYLMPNTRVHQEKGLAVVGATVNMIGWDVPMGATSYLAASEITVLDSPEEGGLWTRVTGVITAMPASGNEGTWTLMVAEGVEQDVLVTDQTLVRVMLADGDADPMGYIAHVTGVVRESDGVVVAWSLMAHPVGNQGP